MLTFATRRLVTVLTASKPHLHKSSRKMTGALNQKASIQDNNQQMQFTPAVHGHLKEVAMFSHSSSIQAERP